MGKSKKGKKDNVEDERIDSDVADTPDQTALNSDDNTGDTGPKKAAKGAKKEKKKSSAKKEVIEKESDQSDDDDEVGQLAKEVKKTLKVEAKPKSKPAKPARVQLSSDEDSDGGTKMKSTAPVGFALLGMDDDDSDSDGGQVSDEPVQKPVKPKKPPAKKQVAAEKETEKKGKKSKKKRGDSDEEDLDKMLAELQAEYAGEKRETEEPAKATEPEAKKDKKSKKGKKEPEPEEKPVADENDEPEDSGVKLKSAADKRKEKKERQKKEAALLKEQEKKQREEAGVVEPTPEPTVVEEKPAGLDTNEPQPAEKEGETTEPKKKKKDKDGKAAKDAKKEEEDGKKKKGPNQKMVAAMQERLRLIKEEEERMQREEEEKIRLLEEAELMQQEQARLEKEKKEMKKQKQKERKEQLKAEGKLLTAKQKADRLRAQTMLDSMRAAGLEVPDPTQKKPRPGTRIRPKKERKDSGPDSSESKREGSEEVQAPVETPTSAEAAEPVAENSEEDVKDAWDAVSSEDEVEPEPDKSAIAKKTASESSDDEDQESDEDGDDDDDESDSDEESDADERTDAEKMRQRALDRIAKRTQDAERLRDPEVLRAGVVCVLGHVDTGKTKILDKLRRTNVQDGEAGGITQQIGATNVPIENIREQTKFVKGYAEAGFKLPGLLIIDTPGHESFSNLRSRGSSLCDIAILVVDIMHGIEPQTLESINLLKSRKTPFVVALNKIDRLYDWQTVGRKDIRDVFRVQAANTQLEFKKRTDEVIVQFAEQGLNAALFHENPDPRSYVSMIPTSAITGEGMGNLLFLIAQFCQNQLAKKLMFSEDLQATVLEVKAIPGLGTTIDAILINGKLREGDTMILAGTEGPIVTQIKALLMPQPMKELRVKNAYVEHKEVVAAQGVKIAAKDLEKAIAGLNLQIAVKPDEVEIFKDIVARELKSVLSSIKLSPIGVYVQASTLGSLEALLEFLRTSKIPYSAIRIGPVVKRDVMKASTMLEHESIYATILAFDVKIERDAQELADHLGVKIFQADIIYHLFDKFMAYRDELKARKRDEFKSVAVFPCKLKILPQFVFNSRDPIVMGVMVEAGIVKEGTPLCVPSKEFVEIGIVTSVEVNHKSVGTARKGQEVCVKIEPIPGDAPKMFGRHFDENDMLVSKISRQSIDACKDYFRDDLLKADWALMVELKKTFEIL